ncbi:MAG: chloride channel protein [Peptococcaceae bacterium]|nr:chloride channel protein [Peptococcaceae bacterium]
MMKTKTEYLLLGIFSLLLGALSGVVLWVVLQLMHFGIAFVWEIAPAQLAFGDSVLYPIFVCMLAGVLIGLIQKHYGALPETMHQVMATVKAEGGYSGRRIWVLVAAFLLPIIFGGAVGPEAGLAGIIAALWTFICRNIKVRGMQIEAMAETGIVAILGAIFGAPLFGIAEAIEPDSTHEHYRDKLLSKKARIYFYGMGVVGIFAVMRALLPFGVPSEGLPRFSWYHAIGWTQWKWSLALMVLGIVMALLYAVFDDVTATFAECLEKYPIVAAMIAGALLGLVGHFVPETMFSGESGLHELLTTWNGYSAGALFGIALLKGMASTLCINFGWRGGNIFPIIYMGAAAGYAFALAVNMSGGNAMLDGGFAVALVLAAMYGFISQKPVTVIAVLLLCFPLTYILPIAVAAFISAKLSLWFSQWRQARFQ